MDAVDADRGGAMVAGGRRGSLGALVKAAASEFSRKIFTPAI
jgi:hypothetical protein